MKRIVLLLVAMLICHSVMAGKIRTIILADTRDKEIGCGIQTNVAVTLDITSQIAACLGMVDDFEDPIQMVGFKCNRDELRRQLASFHCSSDDVVLFFYFGHGARSPQDKSKFPQMQLKDEKDNFTDATHVPIEEVKDILLSKNPRLLIVMGDCCNSELSTLTPKTNSLVTSADGSSEYDPRLKKMLQRLFLESEGYVITTGSTAGESGWYCISKDRSNTCSYENSYGYFTINFWGTLASCTDANITWEKMMRSISDNTYQITKQHADQDINHKMRSQRPVYDIGGRMQKIENPQPKEDEPKPQVDKPINDDTPLLTALVAVASDHNTDSYREKQADKVMRQYFATNARIEVVARNGHTIVESENLQQFFDRISIAERLRNFAIHQKETDASGKIKYLLIHEIYEKK